MFARTPRLLLRPGWIEDAPALAATLGRDEAAARKLARVPWPYGIEDARRFLARAPGPLPEFLIFLRENGGPRLIGGIGLFPDARGEAELGYWIAATDRNRGYATEAGRAVVEIAHVGLKQRRIVSAHQLDNPASGRVLHKLGFRPTGRVRDRHSLARGEATPCALFAREADAETCPPAMRPLAA
jgi:RimJ/RimL family protein N-acetyltransferase